MRSLCNYQPTDTEGIYRCPDCDHVTKKPRSTPPRRNCPAKAPEPTPCPEPCEQPPPGLLGQAINFASSTAKWVAAGRPVRSDDEVAAILEQICQPCEFFNDRGSCSKCGCKVSKSESGFLNKLRRATEFCPIGKW